MGFVKTVFSGLWHLLRSAQRITGMVLFLAFAIFVLNALFSGGRPDVPDDIAFTFDPVGFVVERPRERSRLEIIFGSNRDAPPEIRLRDIVHVLKAAADDERIKMLVLDVDYLFPSGPANAHYIGSLIDDFKQSGKRVVAYGSNFSQAQYLIASHADEIYMHPQGSLLLTGYGLFPTYYQNGLEMVGAEFNVFRVGAYKSAGDPYLFNEMPEESREASAALINSLWQSFTNEVSENRGFDDGALTDKIETLSQGLRAAGGNLALYAVNQGFVDGLMTRQQWREYMIERVGSTMYRTTYDQIDMDDYLAATRENTFSRGDKVAVIIAEGAILDGEQPSGTAGGDTVARHIRRARLNDQVKAIVLRVDSPGGSAFASDIIRQEIELARASEKPVVVSMGSYAASGGYWIAAMADEILAQPTTITGSIGIVAVVPNFEGTLGKLGMNVDGVGTTALSGAFNPGLPLSDAVRDLIQQSVENGYSQFINLVASGRGMEPEDVNAIAQGRVWTGAAALELGLIDGFGTLDDAIISAASRAGLGRHDVIYIEDEADFENQFYEYLFAGLLGDDKTLSVGAFNPATFYLQRLLDDAGGMMNLNDPRGVYALCFDCRVN
jgi:protease IV